MSLILLKIRTFGGIRVIPQHATMPVILSSDMESNACSFPRSREYTRLFHDALFLQLVHAD